MFRVFFWDGDARHDRYYRYYWTTSGCWTIHSKHASPVKFSEALQLLREGADGIERII